MAMSRKEAKIVNVLNSTLRFFLQFVCWSFNKNHKATEILRKYNPRKWNKQINSKERRNKIKYPGKYKLLIMRMNKKDQAKNNCLNLVNRILYTL